MSLLINGLFAQSLYLPCEMRSLFLWGYAQKEPAFVYSAMENQKSSIIKRLGSHTP